MYGKRTETAVAALSRLAQVYDGGRTKLSASDIADDCRLQRPFVAKVLTNLSQAGLVRGSPGPGGGYALTRDPTTITLYDVFRLFEREDCGIEGLLHSGRLALEDNRGLRENLSRLKVALDRLLHDTTFASAQMVATEPPGE